MRIPTSGGLVPIPAALRGFSYNGRVFDEGDHIAPELLNTLMERVTMARGILSYDIPRPVSVSPASPVRFSQRREEISEHQQAYEAFRQLQLSSEPITNQQEDTMAEADNDYTLADLQRLDMSPVERKLKLYLPDDEQAEARINLRCRYDKQVRYLITLGKGMAQLYRLPYVELLGLDSKDKWLDPPTEPQDINRIVIPKLLAYQAPSVQPVALTDQDLLAIRRDIRVVDTDRIKRDLRVSEEGIISANNDYRRYLAEAAAYAKRIEEYERNVSRLLREMDKAVSTDVTALAREQIDLICGKLGWEYLGVDGRYWFKAPMTVMSSDGNDLRTVEVGPFVVGIMASLPDYNDSRVFVAPMTGAFGYQARRYSPFHSTGTWCFGTGSDDVSAAMNRGHVFEAARVMQFLMTRYQAEGPYMSFDEFFRHGVKLEKWWTFRGYNDALESHRYNTLFPFLYADGKWTELRDRALSGNIHLPFIGDCLYSFPTRRGVYDSFIDVTYIFDDSDDDSDDDSTASDSSLYQTIVEYLYTGVCRCLGREYSYEFCEMYNDYNPFDTELQTELSVSNKKAFELLRQGHFLVFARADNQDCDDYVYDYGMVFDVVDAFGNKLGAKMEFDVRIDWEDHGSVSDLAISHLSISDRLNIVRSKAVQTDVDYEVLPSVHHEIIKIFKEAQVEATDSLSTITHKVSRLLGLKDIPTYNWVKNITNYRYLETSEWFTGVTNDQL